MPRGRAIAGLLSIGLLVVMGLAGCSSKSTSPTGTGDVSGLRLGAFASDRSGQYDIYLWDYDAKAFKSIDAIRSTAAETHPTLSSDGRFIAYQVNRGSSGDNIEMYDRTGKFIDLSPLNTAADENEPAFSGDAKLLCYTQRAGGISRVRMFDGVNGTGVALPGLDTTGVSYSDYSPAPNFDGSLIAFVSTRNGGPDIFIYDRTRHLVLHGPELTTILDSPNDDLDPSFSASGRFLTFASNRAGVLGGYDIYLLEFAVTATRVDTLVRNLTPANSPYNERHPSVSDAGNNLVFQSDRPGGLGGPWDLWNYDRTTSTLTHLDPPLNYNSPANDIEPSLKWPY